MSKHAKSFAKVLSRRYRVYFNPQGAGWYMAYYNGSSRQRVSLGVRTKPEAEEAVKKFDGVGRVIQPENVLHSWAEVQKMFLDFKASTGKSTGTIDRYKSSCNAKVICTGFDAFLPPACCERVLILKRFGSGVDGKAWILCSVTWPMSRWKTPCSPCRKRRRNWLLRESEKNDKEMTKSVFRDRE